MQEQDLIEFDSYLNNDLSEERLRAFEDKLVNDPVFKEAFESYKETVAFLKHTIGEEDKNVAFKTTLKNVSEDYFNKRGEGAKKVRRFRPWYYAAAASALLLIGLYVFNKPGMPQYGDYANYEPLNLVVRGKENTAVAQEAQKAFNTKDYEAAAEALEKLVGENSVDNELKLFYAISLVEINKFAEAQQQLNVLTKEDTVFKNKALWISALGYLKQKDYGKSKIQLEKITDDAEEYKKARQLLKKLS